jgi:hypothetical protein
LVGGGGERGLAGGGGEARVHPRQQGHPSGRGWKQNGVSPGLHADAHQNHAGHTGRGGGGDRAVAGSAEFPGGPASGGVRVFNCERVP